MALVAGIGLAFLFSDAEVYRMLGVALDLDSGGGLVAHLFMAWRAVLFDKFGLTHRIVVAGLTRRAIGVADVAVVGGDAFRRLVVAQPAHRMRHRRLVTRRAGLTRMARAARALADRKSVV